MAVGWEFPMTDRWSEPNKLASDWLAVFAFIGLTCPAVCKPFQHHCHIQFLLYKQHENGIRYSSCNGFHKKGKLSLKVFKVYIE